MIGKALYTILSTNNSVKTLVVDRIYPVVAAQDAALPYIVYNQISETPNANKERQKQIRTYRMQIDCYADTYDSATTLALAVQLALSFYTGTVGTTKIDIIVFENENDAYDTDTEIHRKSHDYQIRVKH
jgi:hypothetical protein